jgi:tetratricopeptide (TPR) repeat protein
MSGSLQALVVAVLSLGSPGQREAAQRAVERAKVHVAAGDYDQASTALAEAFSLDPDPAYLYAQAQAERFGGDCATAVRLYRAFLSEDPPDEDRALAERHIVACEGQRHRESPQPSEPQPREPPPSLPPSPAFEEPTSVQSEPAKVDTPRPAPWMTDVAGGVLVGGGVAGVGVGLGLHGRSLVLDRAADGQADTQDEFAQRLQRAIVFNRVGLVTLGVGSALIAAGVIRYIVVASRGRRSRTAAGQLLRGALVIHRF